MTTPITITCPPATTPDAAELAALRATYQEALEWIDELSGTALFLADLAEQFRQGLIGDDEQDPDLGTIGNTLETIGRSAAEWLETKRPPVDLDAPCALCHVTRRHHAAVGCFRFEPPA